jgi:hypothetical protein
MRRGGCQKETRKGIVERLWQIDSDNRCAVRSMVGSPERKENSPPSQWSVRFLLLLRRLLGRGL